MHYLELKIPPAGLVLLFAAAMWLTAQTNSWAMVQIPGEEWVAIALSMLGCTLIIVAAIQFISARTTVNPLTPESATEIVTQGIYKLSRNPMYVGFLVMLVAWGVFLENILSLLLLPLFVLYLNRFQIMPEEKALLTKFGDGYGQYLKSVRRWV
ncbi:isoprenylcysteine carboxylmethyltransferase family protein [Nitrosomonas sp.]|uniref:methyltransferase family protein n=1 Tax=Nitrosomonas sp. TaxID=42353 RepID=UPI002634DAB9|nr:isoprenylcysteine carboxylmethyltransferase family protein [Nitrosomonas sp.]